MKKIEDRRWTIEERRSSLLPLPSSLPYLLSSTLSLLAILGGCSPKGETPEQMVTLFLDKYYIEIDQEGALPLTAGLAEKKLREELKLVEGIRSSGVSPQQAKPNISYKFQNVKESNPNTWVFRYSILIQQEPQNIRKEAVIIVSKVDNAWKITNYDTFDAPPQKL